MKIICFIFFLGILQLQIGCKNAAVATNEEIEVGYQDVVKEEEKKEGKPEKQQSISLEKLIGNKNYKVLKHTDSIAISNIESVLIEGTENEYGRKIEVIKEIKSENVNLLNNIVKDENYIELREENFPFNPTLQFQLQYEDHRVVLLLDKKTGSLGFTSVQGQVILKITEPLKEELIILSHN